MLKYLPAASPSNEPLPNDKQAADITLGQEGEYDPLLSDDKDKFSSTEISALAPNEDKSVKGSGRAKIRKFSLAVEDLELAVGSVIEVTFNDGDIKRGSLAAYSDESLSLEQQISGGFISYEHKFNTIRSIVLLVDPGATPLPPLVKKQNELSETNSRYY